MHILGIETSCDETGVALVEARGGVSRPRFLVLKNLVSSQVKIHASFGGVVPNLAKREHLKNLPKLWERIMNKELGIRNGGRRPIIPNSKFTIPNIDLIAVTVGPGLEPALWTGINFAQGLGEKYGIPVIGANHLEGHLYSFLLPKKKSIISNSRFSIFKKNPNYRLPITNYKKIFPSIALIVSGGHTLLLCMNSLVSWKKLGETRDDAAGEAFDKVARLLKLPYPGGPEIEKLARSGDSQHIAFPRPMLHQKNFDFSFSGLKTAALYYLQDHPRAKKEDVAASFQAAALDVLTHKTRRAAEHYGARSIIVAGGVAANKALRARLGKAARALEVPLFAPPPAYNLDNAAMIAAAAYFSAFRKKRNALSAKGNLRI